MYFNVARVYAQAVASLESEPPTDRWTANFLREKWQDRGLQLLAQALDMQPAAQAAHFWQSVIDTDKALNPLRPRSGFRQLAARYWSPRVHVTSAPSAPTNP
jgi:hypothetical protein